MKFELKDYHQNITDEELIADLKRVAIELKQNYVTAKQQDTFGKYYSSTFLRRFGSWLKAQEKAGLQKTKQQANNKIPEEDLFNNLEEVWVKLGRQPRFSEMTQQNSKYSGFAYRRRFGSWLKALKVFVALINKEKDDSTLATIEQSVKISEIEKTERTIIRRTCREVNWRLRFIVMKRDNFKCIKCGRSPAADPKIILHVDHIKAWANGGETILENLQTLCSKCNIGKSNLE
jgi:hypothetical protein